MKKILFLIICFIVLLNIPVKAEASGLSGHCGSLLYSGSMEDGTNYNVYTTEHSLGNYSINIVHKKYFEVYVSFDGNITPPSTWDITITEGNITYSGTLYLDHYFYDNLLWDKTTSVFYIGTLHALL